MTNEINRLKLNKKCFSQGILGFATVGFWRAPDSMSAK
jgi:hypothetical protein